MGRLQERFPEIGRYFEANGYGDGGVGLVSEADQARHLRQVLTELVQRKRQTVQARQLDRSVNGLPKLEIKVVRGTGQKSKAIASADKVVLLISADEIING